MRLIDADAVLDRYYADWEYHCITMAEDDRQWLRQCIDHAPTINAVPVVHGRWVHLGGDEWCCSACGNVIHTEGRWEKPDENYCPNCGAKMDGEADG